MNSVKLWLLGGIAGCSTALVSIVGFVLLSSDGVITLAEFFLVVLLGPIGTSLLLSRATKTPLCTIGFICCATFVIPFLGAAFGAPGPLNSPAIMLQLAIFGLVGGLVWCAPFAVCTYLRRVKVR